MDPATMAMAASTIAGLFNKGPKMPREIKNLYRLQAGIAGDIRNYSQSVPGSDPQEMAALAQQHGLLGEQQMEQRNQVYGAYNPNTDRGNLADLMQNLTGQQLMQRSSLDSQHLMNALANRRSALLQASGVGQAALGPASQMPGSPGVDFSALFGNLAQSLAYKNARNPKTQGSNGTNAPIINPLSSPFQGQQNFTQRFSDMPYAAPESGAIPLGGFRPASATDFARRF